MLRRPLTTLDLTPIDLDINTRNIQEGHSITALGSGSTQYSDEFKDAISSTHRIEESSIQVFITNISTSDDIMTSLPSSISIQSMELESPPPL